MGKNYSRTLCYTEERGYWEAAPTSWVHISGSSTCFTWVEASPSCSYDNMLSLSQALMAEEQKPSSFSFGISREWEAPLQEAGL